MAAQVLIEEGVVEAAPDPFGEVALVFLRGDAVEVFGLVILHIPVIEIGAFEALGAAPNFADYIAGVGY